MSDVLNCGHQPSRTEPIRHNECTCCGRYRAEFWVCDDCSPPD